MLFSQSYRKNTPTDKMFLKRVLQLQRNNLPGKISHLIKCCVLLGGFSPVIHIIIGVIEFHHNYASLNNTPELMEILPPQHGLVQIMNELDKGKELLEIQTVAVHRTPEWAYIANLREHICDTRTQLHDVILSSFHDFHRIFP